MHVLKGKIADRGLMIDVKVMLSDQRVEALKRLGMPYTQPATIQGLVDTGAGLTGYFANIGPKGPLPYRDVPGSMGILPSPDMGLPIGQADCLGPDQDGNALFKLTVRGRALE